MSLSPQQKALQINLDNDIYGTFAEIGAGQEVVRHFFRVGGASGTIANAMSAYDKDFSDAVYGKDPTGRYVTQDRLEKMLEFQYNLINDRLIGDHNATKKFFSFTDTVATTGYASSKPGHGWVGLRFQLEPGKPPNDVVLHIRLHDRDARQQQEVIGALGVNLIFGCYHYYKEPVTFLLSLYDDLTRKSLEIDMIKMTGPDFEYIDNRLLSLQLVKNGMTDAVIFGPDGHNLHPSAVLYKKNILTIRGSFRPVTNVNQDMINTGYEAFVKTNKVNKDKVLKLFEITLSNLKADGDIEEQDFLDRADLLCSLGHTVLISNYKKFYKLIEYLSQYTRERMGLIIGVDNLQDIFDEKYYRNLNGGILEAFGIMFTRDIKTFLYPSQPKKTDEIITSENIQIHPRLSPLYDYLLKNKRLVDLEDYSPDVLQIFSKEVLSKIKTGEIGWENKVPKGVDVLIKKKNLFGWESKKEAEVIG